MFSILILFWPHSPNKMASLSEVPSVSLLLKTLKTPALKKLSQNFLLDLNLTGMRFSLYFPHSKDKFAKAAGKISEAHVVEIGSGPGALTRSILKVRKNHTFAAHCIMSHRPSLMARLDQSR